jgi:hypothetical protein
MDTLTRPELTPTRIDRESSVPGSTEAHEQAHRIWSPSERVAGSEWTLDIPASESPPEDAFLKVVMTFGDGIFRMEAVDIGVSVEGRNAPKVYGLLVEAVGTYLKTSGDERAKLLLVYPPDTWFKFVPPDQAASNEAALADGFASALNQLYEFKDGLVRDFLVENPFLGSLLFEAREVIRKYFGPEVAAALEVVADPEALGDRQLFVLIRTDLSRKEARALLAELDRGWWLDALPASKGKMEIALD